MSKPSKPGVLNKIGRFFRGVAERVGLVEPAFKPTTTTIDVDTTSRKEAMLTVDSLSVKRKLGRSFFTRKLNARYRLKLILGLNRQERAIARAQGWIA